MDNTQTIDHETGLPVIDARDLEGVRRSRIIAFVLDYIIIAVLCVPFAIVIALLGLLTFGFAWGLFAVLPGLVACFYLALTLGGENQATIGMRMMGIKLHRLDGGPIDPILAILHGILYWVIHFTVFLLAVSLFSSKKRLLHDILLGTYVARA